MTIQQLIYFLQQVDTAYNIQSFTIRLENEVCLEYYGEDEQIDPATLPGFTLADIYRQQHGQDWKAYSKESARQRMVTGLGDE